MSSMRNAVQRRNHKERAQPLEREKWGVLEKHKDYSLRAADFSAKKKRLRALKTKASERNPDEFHFGMVKGQTRDGGILVAERGSSKKGRDAGADVEVMRVLKEQDAGYLAVVLGRERGVLRRLVEGSGVDVEGSLGKGLGGKGEKEGVLGKRKRGAGTRTGKVLFVDGIEEQLLVEAAGGVLPPTPDAAAETSPAAESTTKLPTRRVTKHQRTKTALRQQIEEKRKEIAQRARLKRRRAIERTELRIRQLEKAGNAVADQRARMGKSVIVGGITKGGKRFKIRQRRR